jgi:hypothetical protein
MISVTQGPSINAGLASLDYDKKFEAAKLGKAAIAEAQDEKSQRIRKAFDDMQTQLKESQITASKVQAALQQNPSLFEGLEEGNNLTSKSYKKILEGNASQQDFNNISAYIEAANTQKTNALETKKIEDNKKVAQGIAQITSMSFGGLSESEYDNVTKADINANTMQVLENYTDPAIKNAIYNASIQLGASIEEDDTAAIRTKASNRQDIEDFKNAWINGDDFTAAKILNSNEHFLEIYPVYDEYDNVIGLQSPNTIALSMGLTRVEPKGGNGGKSPNQKPVIELDIQEVEQQFLVDGVWTGSKLTEDQVMQMSDEAIEAYIAKFPMVAKFPMEYAEPGSTDELEANAVLNASEVLVATTSEPVKPNKPNKQSYIAEYAKGFALTSDPYKLAEKMYEADKAKYDAAMIKYKEQMKIYRQNNPRSRK